MNDIVSAGEKKALVRLLRLLGRGEAVMTARDDGVNADVETTDGSVLISTLRTIERAVSAGLVVRDRARLSLGSAARSFLRRVAAEAEETFLAQHADIVSGTAEIAGVRHAVRLNQSESPLGPLSRLKDRDGSPFLPVDAVAAGDRLAADFNRGQLQPRVTASWEPHLSSGSKGGRGGMADMTDSAVAARLAVNRAIEAMGPELSGVALDVCCFMKGLEMVERERQWPARSAKLMLRTALLSLARHYSPPRKAAHVSTQHWGADGYRPEFT
ncbi:DUF6456 domain-containing protein [Rhizobium tubonense]|uniref:DUF6456 domain-containing protein n=1 Tax=Rhizobium tubonense TaxID=484088 RepID=A0A2W4EVL8_9HYPH|nr:DUF6456 domain-containing protein [Rhizobium tubonense]PZM17116.1 hypothetical protein CPY51_02470 [Rhizobium tubonense]